MKDLIIKMLMQRVGLPRMPKDQKDFFNMVASNPQFKRDLDRAESMGILKRNDDGTLNVINQDKVNAVLQDFLMSSMFGGSNGGR